MSVQYYSLASQAGEPEADMAFSKWFLCGAPGEGDGNGEGGFDKDESLAVVFADKAARRNLPSTEFAMGYYTEACVSGIAPDLAAACVWYARVARGSNDDARARLRELDAARAKMLSRKEHEGLAQDTLVSTCTMARERAQASGAGVGGAGGSHLAPVAMSSPPSQDRDQAQLRPQP